MTTADRIETNAAPITREAVADACRALVVAQVMHGVLGHISVRQDDDQLLVRCRGPRERGLRFTEAADFHLVGVDGAPTTPHGYTAPAELPIHTAVLARNHEVNVVIHAHPPYALLAGLADLDLLPIFGAYDAPTTRLAQRGIPIYPRAVLINTFELGADLARTMGDARACILRGHGIVTAGVTLEEAVTTAVRLETLARVAVELRRLGASLEAVDQQDLDQLPDLGHSFDRQVYRNLEAQLAAEERPPEKGPHIVAPPDREEQSS
jgi:ribulose-5-phosphate 4-epimerase/fuculose-1-phosphate aldolase